MSPDYLFQAPQLNILKAVPAKNVFIWANWPHMPTASDVCETISIGKLGHSPTVVLFSAVAKGEVRARVVVKDGKEARYASLDEETQLWMKRMRWSDRDLEWFRNSWHTREAGAAWSHRCWTTVCCKSPTA